MGISPKTNKGFFLYILKTVKTNFFNVIII